MLLPTWRLCRAVDRAVLLKRDYCWIRSPTSATFDELRQGDALDRLLAAGEGEFVERKRAEPKAGFGPIISAFANTAGGWLLLGVADKDVDGHAEVIGFAPPGNAELGDWLRDKLSAQLAEVPSFRAELLAYRDANIGVVRVPPSASAPHFMRDGHVYVRENRRTSVVTSQQQLVEILERARASHETALLTLSTPGAAPVTESVLGLPRHSNALRGKAMPIVLRVAPIYVAPSLRRYVMSKTAVQRSQEFAVREALIIHDGVPRERPHAQPTLHDGGHSVQSTIDGNRWKGVRVAQDARGVLGVRLEGVNTDGVFIFVDDQLRSWLTPALGYLAEALASGGAVGPAALALSVGGIAGTTVVASGHVTGFDPSVGNWFDTTAAWSDPFDAEAYLSVVDALARNMARAAGALLFDDD